MAGRGELHERRARDLPVHVLADGTRGDGVVRALEHERRHVDSREIGPVVGGERDPGEVSGDVRVRAAEAARELGPELRPVVVAMITGAIVLDQPRKLLSIESSSSSMSACEAKGASMLRFCASPPTGAIVTLAPCLS